MTVAFISAVMAHTIEKFLLLLLLAVLTGCAENSTVPVAGSVTYEGRPLTSGVIIFETSGARPAVGRIIEGKIVEVTTYRDGDGAPPGEHKVAIQSVETGGAAITKHPGEAGVPDGYMQSRSLIPEDYGDPEKSGLTAALTTGENRLSFELKQNP